MANIVLARIDDRLIHGQVMTSWVKYTQVKKIVIVDDQSAADPFIGKVIKMSAPSQIKVDIYNISKAVEVLSQDSDPNEKIIILAKHPSTILTLINGGVQIKQLNVGGMGAAPGRKSLYKNISISPEEKEIFKAIIDKGVPVVLQIIPDDKPVDIEKQYGKI